MSNEVDRTLWVGNLHEKVTEEILYELFLQAGPLNKVAIAKDKDGRPKRFAFVTFEHSCSVPYTIQLMNETQLFGSPLKIQCRPGSIHQQHQPQQQQFQMNQNPYQSNAPMGNPYQGNPPAMKPYRSNQPMRSGAFNPYQNSGQVSQKAANPYQGTIPMRSSPQLHKSNTWHGNELSDLDEDSSDKERGKDSRGRDRDRDNSERDRYNSRDRDRDRSGDRHHHGDRNRHDDYHQGRSANRNSPLTHDNYSNGRSSPQESQRDRLLRMQQASLNAYRGQNSRSGSGQSQPWQSRPYNQRRGRY